MYFSSYSLCLFDFKQLLVILVILPNLTYFGHDGSCYFNNYRRTKYHMILKYTVPESLNCEEEVDATNMIVGKIYDIQITVNKQPKNMAIIYLNIIST